MTDRKARPLRSVDVSVSVPQFGEKMLAKRPTFLGSGHHLKAFLGDTT